MPTRWKVLVLGLVAYAVFITFKVVDLADDAFSFAWDAQFHQGHSFSDTQWGAKKLTNIYLVMGVLGVVVVAAGVAEVASWKKPSPPSA